MHFRSRGPTWLLASVVATLVVGACADGPTARDARSLKPDLSTGLPFPCSSQNQCTGIPGTEAAAYERLTVCKHYPAGVTGEPVTITLDVVSFNPTASPKSMVFTLNPGECKMIWGNGVLNQQADTVRVREIGPSGYARTSQVTNHNELTKTSTVQPVTASDSAMGIIGGPTGAGMLVVFTNTPIPGKVGDQVYNDANANGVQDPGEGGIAGVTLTLDGGATTTTDGSGIYGFAGLSLGGHAVTVTVPSGYVLSTGGTRTTTLTSATPTDLSLDFGMYVPVSIGDRVWNDANGNGVQDNGETGLNGATVTVTDAASTVVGTTTTSGDGTYSVANLKPGTYTVCVSGVPAGFTATYDVDGIATAGCSTVAVTTSRTDVDFGYTAPRFSLGDRVWDDADADGVQDAGEGGLTGLTVAVTDAANTVVATTTTGADGAYSVGNLPAGAYKVCVSGVAAGYSPSYDLDGVATAGCATVNLTTSRTDVDFGYFRLGSIGDFVWNDLDKDGIQDANEPGLSGVTVKLSSGATTTTNASGYYSFSNLSAGTYTVTVSNTPVGYVASPSNVGANRAVDSDGSGVAVVVAGAPNTTVDFGFYEKTGAAACTYTQGYWKNHEDVWPAPYSPNAQWMTPQRQVTATTWDGLMGTAPKGGNSYVQLAHQWMAAKLNRANGAPASASVLSTLNSAEAWLLANTPTSGALPSIKNAQADGWMSTLDDFNNGKLGTPHCN